jgi:O-antigen biosynthesis protein WbqV
MHFPKNWQSFLALLHDVVMAGASLWLAHYLRLGDLMLPFSGHYLPGASFIFMLLALLVFVAAGMYRGLWRYASLQDLLTVSRAVLVTLLIFYGAMFLFLRLEGVPRSVPLIHLLLLIAMLGGPRFAYRIAKDRRLGLDITLAGPPKVPVLLIGANDIAELFIRESRRNPRAGYHVVGLVDDNPAHHGSQLHGVRIYGGTDCLARIVTKLERKGRKPQRLVLAEARPGGSQVREILEVSEQIGLPLSRLPITLELQAGSGEVPEIRPIAVEDLLRRAQKVTDRTGMEQMVAGKTVLITGAGGTIGSELVRQIASFAPREIILYEQAEYQLYQIERELADAPHDFTITPVLGDVRNPAQLQQIFAQHTPQIVFHAAALKHVPLAEANPIATITTNVLGSWYVAEAARQHHVERMVLISTDKAVEPSSIMGATKRIAEYVMHHMATETATATRFMAVRFGNVLGSTGSVVPRFQQQLQAGGPLTVTHPEMTRYFMTVREAVELVIQAAALGKEATASPSPLYILDMGEPVKIDALARQMIRLAGLREDQITIEYTGLRPGEKLHEALAYQQEALEPTAQEAIRQVRGDDMALPTGLHRLLQKLEKACSQQAIDDASAMVWDLVKRG